MQGGGGAASSSGGSGGKSTGGKGGTSATGGITGVGGRYPDTFDPNDSPPKVGEPGCGFQVAAFCDTFGGAAKVRGRGGELDSIFWSGARTANELSTMHAMSVGMSMIPECRPDLPDRVWPDNDALICDPTFDMASGHLLVAAAAQHYGQNGYRIRQPIDFTGRTAKIVFDASTDPMEPLRGFLSLAITEDPIATPGYSIYENDEGSIIPKNAVEVVFANTDGDKKILARNIHVFNNYVDTAYPSADQSTAAERLMGKANHFELTFAQDEVTVSITPYSDDGQSFAAPHAVHTQKLSLPFTRGWVQLSVHNHATLKYAHVDAAIARIDNVGFDGPVITNWREYEVPDSLVKFEGQPFQPFQDPDNPENVGYDIGYALQDASKGPKETLTLKDVDLANVETARLAVTLAVDFVTITKPEDYTLQARLNGKAWLDRKLTAEEAALFVSPTTLDPDGKPLGDPGTQGRLALMIDVPLEDLVDGDNTLEFQTVNIPTSYPPVIYNIDLVMQTK